MLEAQRQYVRGLGRTKGWTHGEFSDDGSIFIKYDRFLQIFYDKLNIMSKLTRI